MGGAVRWRCWGAANAHCPADPHVQALMRASPGPGPGQGGVAVGGCWMGASHIQALPAEGAVAGLHRPQLCDDHMHSLKTYFLVRFRHFVGSQIRMLLCFCLAVNS